VAGRDGSEDHCGARRDSAGPVGDLGAVELECLRPVSNFPQTYSFVEARHGADARRRHRMILEIGNSMMSLAPRSFSAGMRVLMVSLGTTVSTA
jgi:hypothetical protein